MSYANGTPNFNLPLTTGTDKRDWGDTNQAFANVDAALKAAGDNAIIADGKADAAQTTADSAATTAASAVTTANSASATAQTAAETAQLAQNAATTAQQTATQAATDAQSALSIASNADTVALAAQANIGTMANLQTTDKTSLVAAINEVLSYAGGASMKCAKFGTVLPTTTGVIVDISDLNLTSSEDYMVICDGVGYSQGTSQNSTIYISSKSATSFTITAGFAAPTQNNLVSYQVITFK